VAGLLLEVSDLHAGYGKAEVLRGLSFAAPVGGVIAVIGPNGAGKSTLLNALMGLLPMRGSVRVAGEEMSSLPLEERVMRGVSLVPEKRELFATMSVEDNLALGGWRPLRLRRPQWRDGLDRVFTLFPRLQERRAQAAGTLSGGERQMLAIGRALMAQPELLMLDEPSLGLAPLVVRDIFGTMSRLRASGVAILLVEQNARAALEFADHGYVLETGDFVLQGPADRLAGDPRIIDSYLGGGYSLS
jgi:branched-chain amino acid transport system ATP-binding protein